MVSQGAFKLRDALPVWWQVARPWFTGTTRMQALRYVALCVGLAVIHTLVAVKVSYAQKHFSTALAEKNRAAWMSAVWEFVVIICLFAPIRSMETYAEKRMVAVWRTSLTQTFVTAYTTNKAYFHMQLARGTEGPHTALDQHTAAAASDGIQGKVGVSELTHTRTLTSSRQNSNGESHSPAQSLGLPVLKTIRVSSESAPSRPLRGPSGPSSAAASQLRAQSLDTHHQQQQKQQHDDDEEKEDLPLLSGCDSLDYQQHHQQQTAAADSSSAVVCAPSDARSGMGRVPGGVVAGLSDASVQVDNPDQRITADVQNYVQTSVSLALLLVRKTLNCAAFAGVLWSISPKLVVFLLSYALLGTLGTAAVFGGPLTRLKQLLLRLEADLRFGLVRLRENAEAIAFYGGDVREAADLSTRLVLVLDVLLRRTAWLGAYELWLVVYRYATILIPSLVLAPEYFAGAIEFGTMTQASFAFNVLEEALRLVLEKMEDLSSLAAETARLHGLLEALRAADVDAGGDGGVVGFGSPPKHHHHHGSSSSSKVQLHKQSLCGDQEGPLDVLQQDVELADLSETAALLQDGKSSSTAHNNTPAAQGVATDSARVSRVLRLMDGSVPGLSVEDLTACVPGRHHQPMVVCQGLTLNLTPGESLLVMGPSGCGKSSLLRIIAGLWTVGSGTIRGPAAPFFLPQKPFMPIGSLRQQLLFPTDCSVPSHAASTNAASPHHHHHDHHHQQHGSHRNQQHPAESHLTTAAKPSCGSSTAVKPSSAVLRGVSHMRTASAGSFSSSSRLSYDPEAPRSATAAAAAASAACADSFGLSLSLSSSKESSADGVIAGGSAAAAAAVVGSAAAGSDATQRDELLRHLLTAVRLGHLLTRFPEGLDAEVDWASVLSLGEQQRVALVRMLFHQPLLAFLDEATAALDPQSEALVYRLITQACSCFVSVGHRLQLLEWHSHVLVSVGASRWVKYSTAEYKQRLASGLEG